MFQSDNIMLWQPVFSRNNRKGGATNFKTRQSWEVQYQLWIIENNNPWALLWPAAKSGCWNPVFHTGYRVLFTWKTLRLVSHNLWKPDGPSNQSGCYINFSIVEPFQTNTSTQSFSSEHVQLILLPTLKDLPFNKNNNNNIIITIIIIIIIMQ